MCNLDIFILINDRDTSRVTEYNSLTPASHGNQDLFSIERVLESIKGIDATHSNRSYRKYTDDDYEALKQQPRISELLDLVDNCQLATTLQTASESLQPRSEADITNSVELPKLSSNLFKPFDSEPVPFKSTDQEPEEFQIDSKRLRVEEDNISEQSFKFFFRNPEYMPFVDYEEQNDVIKPIDIDDVFAMPEQQIQSNRAMNE